MFVVAFPWRPHSSDMKSAFCNFSRAAAQGAKVTLKNWTRYILIFLLLILCLPLYTYTCLAMIKGFWMPRCVTFDAELVMTRINNFWCVKTRSARVRKKMWIYKIYSRESVLAGWIYKREKQGFMRKRERSTHNGSTHY